MNSAEEIFNSLTAKLDAFIRKYYKNKMMKGGIYFITTFFVFVMLTSGFEYLGHFGTGIRRMVFFGFCAINVFVFIRFFAIPLLKLYKLGVVISHEQAAALIGRYFPLIQDKILNTLQLKQSLQTGVYKSALSNAEQELVLAGIQQKINALSPFPFVNAVDLKENLKFFKWAMIPVSIFFIVFFLSPSYFYDGAGRLIDYNSYYAKPAPFTFYVLNKNLKVVQQNDYLVEIKLTGSAIPSEVFIEWSGALFKMEKINNINFNFLLKNIQKTDNFRLFADGIYSQIFTLSVVPKPLIVNFSVELNFPSYLHRNSEKFHNTGDLEVPMGTEIKWNFLTLHTDSLTIIFKETGLQVLKEDAKHSFGFQKKWFKKESYIVRASNKLLKTSDSIVYNIQVVPDAFPSIGVEEKQDSVNSGFLYFSGLIQDDHGLNKLTFNYEVLNIDSSGSRQAVKKSLIVPFSAGGLSSSFFYFFDFASLKLSPGKAVDFYFEIWDNDGLVGSKCTRSKQMVYKLPSKQDMNEAMAQRSDTIKKDLKESVAEAKNLQKEISDFSKKLFQKKEMGWEDKKMATDLLRKQQLLVQKIGVVQKQNRDNLKQSQLLNPEEAHTKQDALNDLMEKLLSEEMKQMVRDLQKMVENLDKDIVQAQMDKLKNENRNVEKELDRSLAIFKQMEFEQKMNEAIDKLNKLAEDQTKLAKEDELRKADIKNHEEKQSKVNEGFQNLKKDLNDLSKKNDALEFKEDFKAPDTEQKAIDSDLKDIQLSLKEGKVKKAGVAQKAAASKMEALSKSLKKMQDDNAEEKAEEDMASLRSILENLLRMSFGEEKLMSEVKATNVGDPKYLQLGPQQRILKEDSKMIEDSLMALGKRVVQISAIVNREISGINNNLTLALSYLEDRQTEQARSRQQYVMTSVNNLALLLTEILESMQKQMAQAKSKSSNSPGGKSLCKKPGNGPPSMSAVRKMQEQLNQQLKDLKEGIGIPKGNGPSSEQIARLAAQQALIRSELNKVGNQYNKLGQGALGKFNKISGEMEQSETDLVNKIFNKNLLNRQQEILGRLLESEKAEKERELDFKRESNEAKEILLKNPAQYEAFKKLKLKEYELLKSVHPSFNPFYKKMVNDYFQRIPN